MWKDTWRRLINRTGLHPVKSHMAMASCMGSDGCRLQISTKYFEVSKSRCLIVRNLSSAESKPLLRSIKFNLERMKHSAWQANRIGNSTFGLAISHQSLSYRPMPSCLQTSAVRGFFKTGGTNIFYLHLFTITSTRRSVSTKTRMEAKRWVLKHHFHHGHNGLPKLSDFELVDEIVPLEPQPGEIIIQAEYISVDPAIKRLVKSIKLGDTIPGIQLGKVIKSKHPQFPEHCLVLGGQGWRDVTCYRPPSSTDEPVPETGILLKLPELKGLPTSYFLGACGITGLTAYFGITKVCQPQPGETLVVSSAAGAVGSVAGQIGKIMGCRVIGLTGTDEKVEWLKLIGFDQAYNYRKVNVGEVFKNEVKQGIDCYFDNVGNDITFHVTKNMNLGGRIALCGSGGVYHDHDDPSKALVPLDYAHVIGRGIRMQGFMYSQYESEFPSAINQLRDWIVEEALKVRETLDNGIESLPQALIEVLEGHNIGKRVVKLWNPPIVTKL